jgi:putative ABC transport system permease protein
VLHTHGLAAEAMVEGRDKVPASVDQPKLTQGSWILSGGVVVERSFADALGVHTGSSLTLNSRSFRVVGIAVSAAALPYPILVIETNDPWIAGGLSGRDMALSRAFRPTER